MANMSRVELHPPRKLCKLLNLDSSPSGFPRRNIYRDGVLTVSSAGVYGDLF